MTKYQLMSACTTRLGLCKPGTLGVGYNQANGFVNFFPDRGGFAVVPVEHLRKVQPAIKEPARRAVPIPVSVLQGMNKPRRVIHRKPSRIIVRKIKR